jgi:nucleoside-diphosphate-sugar epimerase
VLILITGGNGFLGSYVAELLAAQGHRLRLLLRASSSLEFIRDLPFEREEGDMRDVRSLVRAVDGVDAVVHLAGLTSAREEAAYLEVNAAGSANLVHAAAAAGVSRFVYVSSMAARGPLSEPEPDAAPLGPVSAYGRSKRLGEDSVLAERERMRVAIVRPPVVYGPRDRALVPVYRIARLGLLPAYGAGGNQLSWIYVTDVASAIVLTVTADTPNGAVYTVSDGGVHTWKSLVAAFGAALGRQVRLLPTPPALYSLAGAGGSVASALLRRPLPMNRERVAQMRQRYWVAGYDDIERDLGWQPSVGIADGMRRTLAWYRERGWL